MGRLSMAITSSFPSRSFDLRLCPILLQLRSQRLVPHPKLAVGSFFDVYIDVRLEEGGLALP